MIAIIEDPPYDIIGKGDPTIGSKPKYHHHINSYINKESCSKTITI
jgi:hypothetical protein